jgi:hypothetical protein
MDVLVMLFVSVMIRETLAENGPELVADDGINPSESPINLFTTEIPLITATNETIMGCPEQCKDLYESCKRRKHYCGVLVSF